MVLFWVACRLRVCHGGDSLAQHTGRSAGGQEAIGRLLLPLTLGGTCACPRHRPHHPITVPQDAGVITADVGGNTKAMRTYIPTETFPK